MLFPFSKASKPDVEDRFDKPAGKQPFWLANLTLSLRLGMSGAGETGPVELREDKPRGSQDPDWPEDPPRPEVLPVRRRLELTAT